MALRDASLPAGAIVEELKIGWAIRNDGVALRPAAENVWYRILTAYGEQEYWPLDMGLHEKNRRIWNGWACGHLDEGERQELAESVKLPVEDLRPLDAEENAILIIACGDESQVPDPSERIDFSETHFRKPMGFLKCVLVSSANFSSATFSDCAVFRSATFSYNAEFHSAAFSSMAEFSSATFSSMADFSSATFGFMADFRSATFSTLAKFHSATFGSWADFSSAVFSTWADFRSATFHSKCDFQNGSFSGATDFRGVRFIGKEAASPLFHNCNMHQDTRFTLDAAHWPMPNADNASDEKEAFTRLRQIMVELHKPDDQHFFFQREMAAKAFIGPWYDRLGVRLYGWVSDYGWSMMRPLCCLAAVWVIGWLLMLMQFQWHCVMGGGDCKSGAFAAGLSFANLFSFLGFGRLYFGDFFRDDPATWVILISAAQNILGVIFLFFFGLGLRNRFRLK